MQSASGPGESNSGPASRWFGAGPVFFDFLMSYSFYSIFVISKTFVYLCTRFVSDSDNETTFVLGTCRMRSIIINEIK